MAKRSLKITSRFVMVLAVVVPTLFGVAWAGFRGLRADRGSVNRLYLDNVLSAQAASDLALRLGDAQQAILASLLADNPADQQRIDTELLSSVSPDVEADIAAVRAHEADDPAELASLNTIAAAWTQFVQLFAAGVLTDPHPAVRANAARQFTAIHETAAAAAKSIVHTEGLHAALADHLALANNRASLRLMVIVVIFGLLAAIGVVVWLIRSVLTRTLAYSAFATAVTQGEFAKRLSPAGGDELAQLGRTLDELADRREGEVAYEQTQLEFAAALQQTETEDEAHRLLKRHLERTVSTSTVTVLNRNNSADRLEAVTTVAADSPLATCLEQAQPRSCLAVRMARPYVHVNGEDGLLSCPVCLGCAARVTCTPLLVGGEVIGSVLAEHDVALGAHEQRSIRESVTQAAPALGNLRNLAIAELRAATDSLTGLPNRRALEDSVKRMVAQSARTMNPVTALMCDLDHFKHVNDRYGHGRGDDLLAAVGAAISSTLRASDLAGRFGGEEFLILLPATGTDGACVMAEKIRAAVAAIRIPTVDQAVTLSVGVATMPDHAVDADSLQRAADRALYAAKNGGRDRTEVFTTEPRSALDGPPLAQTSKTPATAQHGR